MTPKTKNRFDFKSDTYRSNPWKVFREFREQGPVIPFRMPFIGQGWAATSYEAVSEVFKNDKLFARDPATAGRKTIGRIQWFLPRSLMSLANNMLAKDGAAHRRLRSHVDRAFARRNIDSMERRLTKLAEQQLKNALNHREADGCIEIVEHFARPFPLAVICELLGIQESDRPQFETWFAPLANFTGFLDFFRIARGAKKMRGYLENQFEIVRNSPREGLISELVAVQDANHTLTDDELVAMVFLLFIAGHETTVHLISNCILSLAQHPDAQAALTADWSKCDAVIDEVLRWSSPIQIGKPRFVIEDAHFHGVGLKRGQIMTPLIASANYDPDAFELPSEFRIDRIPNYHLSFGSGPHTCLGMKLARSETRVALKTLFDAIPNGQPVLGNGGLVWSKRPGMRSVMSLRIQT